MYHILSFLQQREIDSILSGQLTEDEEDDVLKELDELIEVDTETTKVKEEIPELPNVPTDNLPSEVEATKTQKPQTSKTRVALEA